MKYRTQFGKSFFRQIFTSASERKFWNCQSGNQNRSKTDNAMA